MMRRPRSTTGPGRETGKAKVRLAGLGGRSESGKDGKPGGYVDVTGEPTYKATLKTLAFDGAKMTATYDFPPDPSVTVTLGATFEGDTAKGTWALQSSSLGNLSGTWTVK